MEGKSFYHQETWQVEEGQCFLTVPMPMSEQSFYDFEEWMLLIIKKYRRRFVDSKARTVAAAAEPQGIVTETP
jgi:hypothetical protein